MHLFASSELVETSRDVLTRCLFPNLEFLCFRLYKMLASLHRNAFEDFFAAAVEQKSKTAQRRVVTTISLSVPLCAFASFPYGLMNLHKFSACIIPAIIASSSHWESFEYRSKNGAMKREKLICRRRWGSRNLWCIWVAFSSVFAWIASRLRLGFDLFSHSFHNLIKDFFGSAWRTGEETAKSVRLGHKRNFPFMDEGWTQIHCECRAMM